MPENTVDGPRTSVEYTMSKEQNVTNAQLLQLVAKFAQFLPLNADKAEVQKVIEDESDPFWTAITNRLIKVACTATDMIAAGNYDWVNSNITEARFPVPGNLVLGGETKVFHFDRNISSEDAIAEMGKEWRPANFYELLDYGIKNPDEQRKYPIIALGSVVVVDGSRRVACLDGSGAGRGLSLSYFDVGWRRRYRFLAVRK